MFKITYSFGETSVCYEAETIEGLVALVEGLVALVEGHYADDENDGWVEWSGNGRLPFPGEARVDVKFRCGEWSNDNSVNFWNWKYDINSDGAYDIIAYKVIKS